MIRTANLGNAIKLWSLDGYEYKTLPFVSFQFRYEILDGAGTGRTQGVGWEMFRQPEGTIYNFSGTVGAMTTNNGQNEEFAHLVNTLASFGKDDFKPVSFITPHLGIITQDMYSPSGIADLLGMSQHGIDYWGSLSMTWIAKKAYMT